ncbi:MAG: class II aldolase/adducin family protein [Deltaproteobacteria bacterium]|nr:class II aldolase/adducin family protein [Deltaproteobacteria bacterium]
MPRSEGELRQQVTELCRLMHARGLMSACDGNVSVRLGSGRLLVTPSGINKAFMQPAELVVVDGDGRSLRRGVRPTTELPMHREIYAERADAGCVIHAHPPHAVACTLAGISLETLVLPEAAFLLGAVPTIPYETPGTDAFARALRPHLGDRCAFLLERHGCVTLGADPGEAFNRLESLEHVARVLFISRSLGELRPLEPGAAAALRAEVERRGLPWRFSDAHPIPADLVEVLARRVLEKLRPS